MSNGPSICTYRSICLLYTVQRMSVKNAKKAYPLHFFKNTNSFFMIVQQLMMKVDSLWKMIINLTNKKALGEGGLCRLQTDRLLCRFLLFIHARLRKVL